MFEILEIKERTASSPYLAIDFMFCALFKKLSRATRFAAKVELKRCSIISP